MQAFEIMATDVATCREDDSVNRAAQLMWERRCGCVPVLDANDKVVGILTDRDVCMAAYTQGRRLEQIPVHTAMATAVHGCHGDANLVDILEAMRMNLVHRMPVLDPEGRLQGIISFDDIVRTAVGWDIRSGIDPEEVALTLAEIARRRRPEPAEPLSSNLSEIIRGSLDVLKTLRDEIRLDLNLAGKEMRDRWKRLESEVRLAEARARTASSDGAATLGAVIESVRKFRSALQREDSAPSA